jgi:hypothetical protein
MNIKGLLFHEKLKDVNHIQVINAHDLSSKDSITQATSHPIHESSDKEIRDEENPGRMPFL